MATRVVVGFKIMKKRLEIRAAAAQMPGQVGHARGHEAFVRLVAVCCLEGFLAEFLARSHVLLSSNQALLACMCVCVYVCMCVCVYVCMCVWGYACLVYKLVHQ